MKTHSEGCFANPLGSLNVKLEIQPNHHRWMWPKRDLYWQVVFSLEVIHNLKRGNQYHEQSREVSEKKEQKLLSKKWTAFGATAYTGLACHSIKHGHVGPKTDTSKRRCLHRNRSPEEGECDQKGPLKLHSAPSPRKSRHCTTEGI